MIWYSIGNLSLYTLIGFAVLMLAVMAWRRIWYWFTVFSVIVSSVVGGEIVSFIRLHKSISTQYGEWIQREPFFAISALVFMIIWMVSLYVHLIAYAFRKKK